MSYDYATKWLETDDGYETASASERSGTSTPPLSSRTLKEFMVEHGVLPLPRLQDPFLI